MTPLFFEVEVPDEVRGDCERMCEVASDRGYDLTPSDAMQAWKVYSRSLRASRSWAILPAGDAELFRILTFYLTTPDGRVDFSH